MLGLTRKVALLLSFSGIAQAGYGATPLSVAGLEQFLTATSKESDGQSAKKLAEIDLTQRLSPAELSRWLDRMPGQKSRQALLAMADKSAFLDLPPQQIPPARPPDTAAQRRMLTLSHDYIHKTIHQLPNIFARRVTASYQETLWEHWLPETGLIRYEPLHFVGQYSADVLYRNGGEEAHDNSQKQRRHPVGLQTSGEFGLLQTVLDDAVQGKVSWSHWEQGADGLLAVYRYTVPAEKSHYQVGSSWLPNPKAEHRVVLQQFTGYQGEIAMDPSSGTILRLMLVADPKPEERLAKANILVDYGPVVLDGKTYICPLHSVALSLAADIQVYSVLNQPAPRFLQTSLNDVVFDHYHLFHADAHILNAMPEQP
jgi:hypothetical protein